jgi:hypothetical protein
MKPEKLLPLSDRDRRTQATIIEMWRANGPPVSGLLAV